MPASLVFTIVFAVFAAVAAYVCRRLKAPPVDGDVDRKTAADLKAQATARKVVAVAAVGFAVLSFLCLLASSYNPVPTKEEGVKTVFGATHGSLDNGFHLTWPWVKVHLMDAAIQTDSFTESHCLRARIANQQTGCVNISIRWRIVPGDSPTLYKDYRSFGNVRDSLVTRKLTAAVNAQVANYNPLDAVSRAAAKTGAPPSRAPALGDIAQRVKGQMTAEIGKSIEVIDVILPLITFDEATQNRINQLQQQFAQTRIADQQVETNKALAGANKALAKSVDASPNVLVARCLDTLEELVKAGRTPPAGFSCWPGGSSAIVVPATGPQGG